MSGRAKIKVYQYNKDGKFINEYNSQSEVRFKYFSNDISKRPLFRDNNYQILKDGTVITTEKLGRDFIKKIIRRENNEFINLGNKIQKVEVYNLDNKLIATFASVHIASKMSNIHRVTLEHRLKRGTKHGTTDGLYFKYK